MTAGFGGKSVLSVRCTPQSTLLASSRAWRRLALPAEEDLRFRMLDYTQQLAHKARQGFALNISNGDASMDLALAALQIVAEDDALISVSPIPFPAESYVKRIDRLATNIGRRLIRATGGTPAPAETAIPFIEQCLFQEERYRAAEFGRTNIPAGSIVDHPGVWEDQTFAYMNNLLVGRVGIPALLTILYQDIMKRLLLMEVIDFVVKMDSKGFSEMPTAQVLPGMDRSTVVRGDGVMLNTCTSDALVEILHFLKRAFWPFSWDSSQLEGGGFRGAVAMLLDGEMSADLEAISRTAKHRLERGIFTSTGAGDIRRALIACERLVMLSGDKNPRERRDLAVLLCHTGDFGRARCELEAYMDSSFHQHGSLEEKALVQRMYDFLQEFEDALAPDGLMSVEYVLSLEAPVARNTRSLTW